MIPEIENIPVQKTAKSRINELFEGELIFGKLFTDHMLTAEYSDGKWQQFKIEPYAPISINPSCLALHYGQTIFEGMKAYKSSDDSILLFRPDKNIARFNISAQRMCMPTVPEDLFLEGLKKLMLLDKDWIPKKEGQSLYIRPFMFASDEYLGVKPSSNYRFMVICSPAGAYYTEPVNVKIETRYTRAAPGGTGFAKSGGNYGGALLPAKLAQKDGFHQLLWTDSIEHKYVEESGTMNVFFLRGNTLYTPKISETILNGVTRDSVINIAKEWKYQVQERRIAVEEVLQWIKDGELLEAFGTGTAATIAHIAKLNFEGEDYVLPPMEQRKFGPAVQKFMDQLRRGEIKDDFNWVFRI